MLRRSTLIGKLMNWLPTVRIFVRIFFYGRQALDKGTIAFCIFVYRELAHVGWVAMNEEAKKYIDPLPFHVDFSNKEACTGGTRTVSKYEGKGLMTYGYVLRFQFLRQKGIAISRNSVAFNNISSKVSKLS